MADLSEKLRSFRIEKKMSQEELAQKAKLTKDFISRIERGVHKNLTIDTVENLSKALNIYAGDLLENYFGEKLASVGPEPEDKNKPRFVPVLGKANCGGWDDFANLEYPVEHAQRFEPAPTKDPQAFYIIAKGNSMVADDIQDGDLLLVEPNSEVVQGDRVLARDPEQGCVVKRFYRDGEKIRLQPMNPEFPPLYPKKNKDFRVYRIAGKFSKY